jgi:hypothetical protein
MNEENQYGDTFCETGDWLKEQIATILSDIKKEGMTEKNSKRYKELLGRAGQWIGDLSKFIDD